MSAADDEIEKRGYLTARTLTEALPYIQRYDREMVVIKYGGHAMTKPELSKLFATDKAQEVIDKAVQLHGGDGVRKGHIVESLYREIRALRIYEGASDVQKVVIARQVLADKS